MSWKNEMNDAILKYVQKYRSGAESLVEYEEYVRSYGCGCCADVEFVTEIDYINSRGKKMTYEYPGKLSLLIYDLSD